MERFHIFLPEDTLKALRKEAKKQGISISELLRRAAQEYVSKTPKG